MVASFSLPSSRRRWLAGVAAAAMCWYAAMNPVHAQTAPAADDPPNVLIEKAAANILQRIKTDRALKSGSTTAVNDAVDELILPYVDFTKTTRLAVGRYWRDATEEQRNSLVREFRNMLVRTYGGAVSAVSPEAKVEMRPFRAPEDATDVVVRTLVSDSGREPLQVDYRLEKTGDGWKIYDLNVLGVWFIQNYRNQFSTIASQSGVDGLIKALATRNQQLQTPQ